MARCSCVLTGTGVTGTLTLSQYVCVEIKQLQAPHAALSPELHLLDGVTQLTD